MAFITKLCWQLCKLRDILWIKLIKSKYLRGKNSLVKTIPTAGSWMWNGLIKCRKLLISGMCYSITTNSNLSIWQDPWIPDFKPKENEALNNSLFVIRNLMENNGTQWNEIMVRNYPPPPPLSPPSPPPQEEANAILGIDIQNHSEQDELVWYPSKSEKFTIKSAYR